MESLIDYIKSINANDEVTEWVNTTGKKYLTLGEATVSELEHIVDYLVSDKAPKRLRKMSFKDAKRKSSEWSASNKKKGRNLVDSPEDIETVLEFKDKTSIVRLKTKASLLREGFLMNHCVGGYDASSENCLIYSYRDANNEPHATFEIQKDSEQIVQIKGKGNGEIHPKYINPILEFLKHIGFDIRSNDMRNLGYYKIDEDHLDFVKDLNVRIVELSGTNYVV